MTTLAELHIDCAALERTIQSVEPSALLVSARVLRRVIRRDRKLARIGLEVPHAKSYIISREALRPLVVNAELGLKPDAPLPSIAILLIRPSEESLGSLPRSELLLRYWRFLFHAHVHLALERLAREQRLTDASIRLRVHRIGATEFNEIRAVLRQEHFVLPPRDDRTVYVEFAAVYLELRHFAPSLLPRYFPALQSYEQIDAVLAEDVDALRLFAGTRLPGVPDPTVVNDSLPNRAQVEPAWIAPQSGPVLQDCYYRLMERADYASARGNVVRAAILRARGAMAAPVELAERARAGARAELAKLAGRLQATFAENQAHGLLSVGTIEGAATSQQWQDSLDPLLSPATDGSWPTEARLLNDLQQACVDRERDVYSVDLFEWATSLGRRPIKRLLPFQPHVLALKHFRSATRWLRSARISEDERASLASLLASAIHGEEHHLRSEAGPAIADALREANLIPENYPEQIAFEKVTDELLDQACERGYLRMSDLRDAVSRNGLKLPDLAGPKEFFLGDRLIQANSALTKTVDGIYHGGEIYLRWLQRFSSLAFGTPVGRFLTSYLVLPFGGAYVALEGVHYLLEEILGLKVEMVSAISVGVLGFFFLLLLHVARFRQQVLEGLQLTGQVGRTLLIDLPSAVVRQPLIRAVLTSQPVRFLYHYALKPLMIAMPVGLVIHWRGASTDIAGAVSAVVFVAAGFVLNSRWGRDLEEAVIDRLMQTGQRIFSDILPGLFRLIMDFFKRLIEAVDGVLYAVSEWLRFHVGDSRLSMIGKAVLGLVWSSIVYVLRFAINLLIEPQINPIKHFPVVTVSHKLLLPLALSDKPRHKLSIVGGVLAGQFGLSVADANFWALCIVFSIPGIFGFMVWEFKENWRLYRANRPNRLPPSSIGHHGETMLRLLRPGFHSGTLPRICTRLRRAERHALRTGDQRAVHKQHAALEQVQEAIQHFVERSFLAVLARSRGWGSTPVHLEAIALGSNRVRIELAHSEYAESNFVITLEEQSGWLIAGIASPGWLPKLSAEQRRVLRVALAGFYKFAGIDLVREQIEASFSPARITYDIADEGLVVWTGRRGDIEVLYDLSVGPEIAPRVLSGQPNTSLPVLSTVPLLFRDVLLSWDDWVAVWEQDQAGKGVPESFLEGVRLI